MATKIVRVQLGRTNTIFVKLGQDVSSDVFRSQIRKEKSQTSELIAEWDVSFLTDGSDGDLVLTLDDSATEGITYTNGFMDILRVFDGEPLSVMPEPLEVVFEGTVTQ